MAHRALVIEDDHVVADVLRMKLEREGHEVTIARNQNDAYLRLDEQRFDFVLLDLRLPTHVGDMNPHSKVGFDILDHIRDRFTRGQLPVIVMTAYEETSQTAVRALTAGANDYITKPFEDSPVSLDEKLVVIVRSIKEASRSSSVERRHELVFTKEGVKIDGIVVKQRFVGLLRLLGSRTLMFSPDCTSAEDPRMTGKEIAKALGLKEATVRQNVTRFCKWIAEEYERRDMGSIAKTDIIRNARDWKGYELNFETCYIRRG